MFNFLKSKFLRYADRSPKWRNIRNNHLKLHNKCEACGSTKDLEVHHIVPVHIDADKELDPSNLITLCAKSCHLLFGHLMDFKSYNPQVVKDSQEIFSKIRNRPKQDK